MCVAISKFIKKSGGSILSWSKTRLVYLLRILVLLVILLILYLLFVNELFIPPEEAWPVFSLRSGEFFCNTQEECINMAREKVIREWENNQKLLDYVDRWNKFVGLSVLPLRYKISLVNLSYNQIKTTGSIGEKRQLPAKVVCAQEPFIEIWKKPIIPIVGNIEFSNINGQMRTLLNKFDGCWWDITYANLVINKSLKEKKLVVGPNENIILSKERVFSFPISLDGLSHFFIILQLCLILPALLMGYKPVIKFVLRGVKFFVE